MNAYFLYYLKEIKFAHYLMLYIHLYYFLIAVYPVYFHIFWGIYLFLVYYQQYSSLQRIYQSWGIFGSDNFYESVLRSKMFLFRSIN